MSISTVKHVFNKVSLTTTAMMLVLCFSFGVSHVASAQSPCVSLPNGTFDNSSDAIIKGGAPTIATIQKAYASDATVRDAYNYSGITTSDINNLCSTAVAGTVYQNGDVYVGNKLVATSVLDANRNDINGSRPATYNGFKFHLSAVSASLSNSSTPAYVVMQNGKFQFGILNRCGNEL